MYLEVSRDKQLEIIDYLDQHNISYELTDATLPEEIKETSHFELPKLSKDDLIALNLIAIGKENIVERRHKPWEDKFHTPFQEAKGQLFGDANEEEVTYEQENY